MKTIAVDIDDTLTESAEAVRKLVNKKLSIDLKKEHYRVPADYWGYYERVWEQNGLKLKLSSKDIYEELHSDQTLTPLMPGAEFAINELLKRFNIILITSRDSKWEKFTKDWIQDQFPSIKPELYFCDSHRDSSAKTKGQIAKSLGAAWLIDDNVDHCLSATEAEVTPILFGNYGWQQNKSSEMLNLNDWPQIIDYFNSVISDER